jgi:hypothetical protein
LVDREGDVDVVRYSIMRAVNIDVGDATEVSFRDVPMVEQVRYVAQIAGAVDETVDRACVPLFKIGIIVHFVNNYLGARNREQCTCARIDIWTNCDTKAAGCLEIRSLDECLNVL